MTYYIPAGSVLYHNIYIYIGNLLMRSIRRFQPLYTRRAQLNQKLINKKNFVHSFFYNIYVIKFKIQKLNNESIVYLVLYM